MCLEELFSLREVKESSTLVHQGKSKVRNYRPKGAACGAPSAGSESTPSALDKGCREKWGLLLYSAGSTLALQLERFWAPVQLASAQQPLQQFILMAPHTSVPSTHIW